jgi:hypothetical protein
MTYEKVSMAAEKGRENQIRSQNLKSEGWNFVIE